MTEAGLALAFPALAFLAAPIVAAALQNGIVFSSEAVQPKFEKVSPLAGFKRLVSAQTLVELLKSLLKVGLVGAALAWLLWPERDAVVAASGLEAGPLLSYLGDLAFRMLAVLTVLAAAIAGADYGWQWFSFMRKMRMTKEEVKEEHKQNEGDPHIKQKRRAIQIERSRRRMMADVPKATVVLMNPTHYAVALRFVAGETPAPEVVAKGVDALALKIRAVAEASKVPVIENPPLARTLHAACEIGEFIPQEHYQAVAEVISYVLRLSEQQRG
jgi:flagellar biosynthetic protein FlhB